MGSFSVINRMTSLIFQKHHDSLQVKPPIYNRWMINELNKSDLSLLKQFRLAGQFLIPALAASMILAPPVFAAATPSSAVPSLSVVGSNVYYPDGQLYIPEGISVYGGLEGPNYNLNEANINAQIIAASKYWHANTIRLQVAESNLFSQLKPGENFNPNFLRAIKFQVNLAHSYGMAVVINDQTEFTSKTAGPTKQTVNFWRLMAKTFSSQPYVIFDIFNEPRFNGANVTPKPILPVIPPFKIFQPASTTTMRHRKAQTITPKIWNIWQNGGLLNGVHYVGMQTVVNQIRALGANNLIWVEGLNWARVLPDSKYLLTGTNLVYSIHHPNLNAPSSWNQIANLSNIVPVVDGEWAQYQSSWAECFSKAYANVPVYLNFLRQHNIGLIAWSLQPGSLLQGSSQIKPRNLNSRSSPKKAIDLKTPSRLLPNYSCGNEFGQGAGRPLQNYFTENSKPFSVND
jgi:hypothetical protein